MATATDQRPEISAAPRPLLTRRGLRLAATLMIAGQLIVRAVALTGGYFDADDFKFLRMASLTELTPDYLLQFHNGHLMPGGFLYVWYHQHFFPGSYVPAIVAMLLVQLATSVAMWLLLTRIFGYRAAVLPLMAWWCFTVMTLEVSFWWAAAINALPVQFFGITGALFVVRMVRRKSIISALLVVVCYLAALSFFQKAVLLVPLYFALACAIASPRTVRTIVREVVVRYAAVWIALVAISGAYLVYYRTNVVVFDLERSPLDIFRVIFGTYFYAILPALLGGPWTWFPEGGIGAAAQPSDITAVIVLNIVALVVIVSLMVRRHAAYAWILLFLVVFVDIIAISIGRLLPSWTFIGQIYRYTADAAPVAVLVLGFAFLPVIKEKGAYTRRGQQAVQFLRSHRNVRLTGVIVSVNVIVLSSLISTQFPVSQWQANPARAYFANVRSDLRTLPPDAVLMRQLAPQGVMDPLFGEYAMTEALLGSLPNPPTFSNVAEEPWIIREDGRIVPGHVSTVIPSDFGPNPGCGWPITNSGGSIGLKVPAMDWSFDARISYLGSTDGTAEVALGGGTPVLVPFRQGAHEVTVQLVGGGDHINITNLSEGLALCVGGAVVGQLEPAEGYRLP